MKDNKEYIYMKLKKTIDEIRRIIISAYKPDKIILFGSITRGDFSEESDVDVVVVSDKEKDLPRVKRGLNVRIILAKIELPIDILFFTHEELQRWINISQSFSATLAREGKTIYEKRRARIYI